MDKDIARVEEDLIREGLKPGTFPFDAELRQRKVELCKTRQGVGTCWECKYFDHCQLIKQHLVDLRYHRK